MSQEYRIETERDQMDVVAIHAYLTRSYWAMDIPLELVAQSLDHSLCFGLFQGRTQVGFARVVSDRTTFAYLADVYVLEEHRGKGLSRRLVEAVMQHPDLRGIRRFSLVTRDAHGLYTQYGFEPLAHPDRHMERVRSNLYRKD